jgi:hypothetical protein
MPDDRRPVGKIPLQRKLVPRHAVEQAAARVGAPAKDAAASEERALRELSEAARVPAVNLRAAVIELGALDAVPREVAEALRILPVVVRGDRIVLAMADPANRRAIDEIEFVTGKAVEPRVAPRERLVEAVAAAYDAKARGEQRWVGPDADPEDPPSGIR